MSRFYRKDIAWLALFGFFFSLFSGIGAFNPRVAIAYDAPPKDQGHTGPNPPPPPPQEPPPEKCQATGSPVHLKQGDYFYEHTDVLIPGRGFRLELTRHYDSQNEYEGPFGYGWSFEPLMNLIKVKKGDEDHVIVHRGDGVRLQFLDNGDGTFTPPAGRHDTLIRNTDGSYDLSKEGSGCPSCEESAHFDSVGQLLYLRDANGNQMDFSYDTSGKITAITDPSGRPLYFAYGPNNKVSTVTDPAGRVFAYGYDSAGNLTTYNDPAGNTTTYNYDSKHNLTTIVDPLGNTIQTMTYDAQDRLSTYTEKGGTWQITYYPDQNRADQKDPNGKIWQYYYNATGQMTQKKDALGYLTYYTWDSNQNLISKKDARGYTTTYTYDSEGNRLTKKDALGQTTTYTYDPVSNKQATVTDPMGHVTKYEYDSNRNNTKVIRDFGGPLQSQLVVTYDSSGNRTGMTDPMGNATSYSYDATGNLIEITDATGNTTTFTYDDLGNKLTETDSLGNATTYTYDALNKVKAITNAMGNTVALEYDAASNLASVTDPLNNKTSYNYDSHNQLSEIIDPLGNKTKSTYDSMGNQKTLTDANGNVTTYVYDAMSRLTSETNALGYSTNYAYDTNGNRLSVTDAKGNITTNTYDAINRITKITYPEGTYETISYNADDLETAHSDRKGNTINKTYDSLHRLLVKTYPDGTTTNYSYDLNGNILTASNPDISYFFAYDALNRITQINNTTLGKIVSYAYACCNLKSSMTDPEGGVTNYTYDALKRLTSLTNPQAETTNYQYDNLSRITRKNLANGSYTTYNYDAVNRLLNLVNKKSDDSIFSSYSYTYDNKGNRTSMTSSAGTHNYNYDKIYQLLQATHPSSGAENYSYDAAYNRLTSSDHNDWAYDSNNRLLSYNGFAFTYDANGSMTQKTEKLTSKVTSYQFDYENRLKRIDYSDGTYSEYRYDPFGNRIKKDVNGSVTWFVYDLMKGLPDIIAEYDSAGSIMASYTHGPGTDDVISMKRNGNSYFYQKDSLGSITALIDGTETIINSYEYDAYGNVITKTESSSNPYGYTGRELDSESGLMYYRARYYDPAIGRFITADPIGFDGGLNFYAYVQNDPVNWIDPLGLKKFCVKPLFTNQAICWNVDDNNKIDDNPEIYEVENYPCIIDCWFEDKEFEEALERGENDNCI